MSEYLATRIPGAGNGTHGVYLLWLKGVGKLFEGTMGVAESSSNGRGKMEEGIAVHDVTVGEQLVYNILITTLFLLFLLTTVALLIFLLMRWLYCCHWCSQRVNRGQEEDNNESNQDIQEGFTYLSETHGVVTKKRTWDNPPPYESPPDFHSLNPEIIMDAKTLLLNASNTNLSRKISNTVTQGVHRNFPSPVGHGSPLVNSTGDNSSSPKERENRKISLQCPPNIPPRLKRKISSPSSMPPTIVIQPPPHYDTLHDIGHKQTIVTLHLDTTSTNS